jgi:hypothetical protein
MEDQMAQERDYLYSQVKRLENQNQELREVVQGAVDHCEGWRKFQEDSNAVPFFPLTLEKELRAALAKSKGAEGA